jgi:SAM-dependent methyltransferase
MDVTYQTDTEQTALWNGLAGRAWVEAQELLDHVFRPLEELLAEAVVAGSGSRALDVGCGTGSTTLAVARLFGANGRSVGIDISEPMIVAARARAEREALPARFIHADAQIYAFEPASFDMIISRFGVMFFDDSVRAFANLRRAATDHAELRFVAWRSAAENPFMTTAERAAAALLPNVGAPARRAGAVRLSRPAPGFPHAGGKRLGRDRHPADRCFLQLSREGVGRLSNPVRSARPDPS